MILLGLGANLPSQAGPPAATLRVALAELSLEGIVPVAVSRFFLTTAWPNPCDPPFVNAVARIETDHSPGVLLNRLLAVETRFGRVRDSANAPRPLDLDLLDYNGLVMSGPPRLPHSRMEHRGFVLVPLAEVAPSWRHPVSGRTAADLMADLSFDEREFSVIE